MYQHVLVPTDGSEAAGVAADHAVGIARRYDATLSALNVVDLRFAGMDYESAGALTSIRDALLEEGEDVTTDVARRAAQAGVGCQTAVVEGSPHRAILEYVDEEGVDLVAMGTHGRAGLERLLLGSVAERVVRTSPVPVLTVGSHAPDATTDYREVLVATDASDGSAGAVDHALDFAGRYDATLHAVYVVDTDRASSPTLQAALEEAGADALASIEERGSARDVAVETTVLAGTPHEEICAYADREGVDLVAVGTRGREGLERLLLGSVAGRVVRTAPAPVLTVRAKRSDE